MSKTVSVNFKLEAEDKRRMEQACNAMGLTMAAAFTIFAKKVGQESRIPFEVSADPFYSESNINALRESIIQMQQGKTVTKTLDELASYE